MVSQQYRQTLLRLKAGNGEVTFIGIKDMDGDWKFQRREKEGLLKEDAAVEWRRISSIFDQDQLIQYKPTYVAPQIRSHIIREILTTSTSDAELMKVWWEACYPGGDPDLFVVAKWLLKSNKTVVLTGAGMSTESNIPDFRSASGWWRQIDPRTVATTEALTENYELFHEFYSARIRALEKVEPHEGHRILASWEERNLVNVIATQNVDGLHGKAGSRRVYELHGSIHSVRCGNCSHSEGKEIFLEHKSCTVCSGRLRPNVVLFGEMLPEKAWGGAMNAIEKADLVIVIGTSLEVYPANQLSQMTKGRTVYINAEVDEHTSMFDLSIEGKAKRVLMELEQLIDQLEER